MLSVSRLSMQKMGYGGGHPRMTQPICWERVSGRDTPRCIPSDAKIDAFTLYTG